MLMASVWPFESMTKAKSPMARMGLAMGGSLTVLYNLSIVAALIVGRNKRKRQEREAAEERAAEERAAAESKGEG